MLAFVPFYWLNLGGPELLLIAQATIVAIGAWPLYQLASLKLANQQLPESSADSLYSLALLVFPLAYLLLPTLQSALLFEFHAVTLAPTFFLFAFLSLENQQHRRFILFIALAMACKEDMPLIAGMIGLFYVGLGLRRWRLAATTTALSVSWFVLAVLIIPPYFTTGDNIQLDRYAWLGDFPFGMIQTVITQPQLIISHLWDQANAVEYLTWLLFPTAFLALLHPLTLLPILPTLAINLLSDQPFTWRLEDFHYGVPMAPFLFVSAIYGLHQLHKRLQAQTHIQSMGGTKLLIPLLALLILTFSVVYHINRGYTPLAHSFIWPEITPHHQQLNQIIDTIPDDAIIATQQNLAPHLTHRPIIYADVDYFTQPETLTSTPATDILLDITAFDNQNNFHQFLTEELINSGHYQIITARNGILHLQPHTTEQPALPKTFYTFTQPDTPSDYPMSVDFGDAIRLRGYSLHFNRQEEVEVTLDLEALKPLDQEKPVLYLLDEQGQALGATIEQQPAFIWLPPPQWTVGEVVRLRFNTLPWHTRQTAQYRLALGIITGDDVWQTPTRLHPNIDDNSPYALRVPLERSLLELAHIQHRWDIPQGGPKIRRLEPPLISRPLAANFDGQIKMLGYKAPAIIQLGTTEKTDTVATDSLSQSPHVSVPLYWQALKKPEPVVRFAQLISPAGQLVGQNDSSPDYGMYPTNLWVPNEVVIETVTFPIEPSLPEGRYSLHIGFYSPDTGQ
ncbi:MAG: DUF2079 domain-containing protein, partial [Chloroflexota bacterium]